VTRERGRGKQAGVDSWWRGQRKEGGTGGKKERGFSASDEVG